MATSGRAGVGIDIGGTAFKLGLIAESGEVIAQCAVPSEAERGPDHGVARLAEEIGRLLTTGGVDRRALVGVGMGAPGPMKYSAGLMYEAANLPAWRNAPLRDWLAQRTGQPVVLDNDANMAAWGELWRGAGRGTRDMVLLTLGTGVGGGVIADGELVRGAFENAGELGHMIVVPGGRPCNCGQRGCLEAYSSAGYVAAAGAEAARAHPASLLAGRLTNQGDLTSEDVVECARRGDEAAQRVWDEACYHLGIAIVSIQHAFNPQRVVLGGGMSAAGDFLLTRVREHFERLTWRLALDQPEIVLAELGNDAGIIGAAGQAFAAVDRPA